MQGRDRSGAVVDCLCPRCQKHSDRFTFPKATWLTDAYSRQGLAGCSYRVDVIGFPPGVTGRPLRQDCGGSYPIRVDSLLISPTPGARAGAGSKSGQDTPRAPTGADQVPGHPLAIVTSLGLHLPDTVEERLTARCCVA